MLHSALIGCGAVAQVHAQALRGLGNTRPVAFADIRPERAGAFADTYGGTAYSSLEDMLNREHIDVLHLCTPHHLHTPMAAMAAERGVHVFTEKPPAISRGQLREFAALEEKIRVGVCFQNRYNQSVNYLRGLLRSGRAGAVKGARAFVTWQRDEAYYTGSDWRGRSETEGGGALINQSIHTLDLLVHFLGKPSAVEAGTANHHLKGIIGVEDTVEAYIDFGGIFAGFYATTAHCCNSPVFVELCCERATLRMEETEVRCFWADGQDEQLDFTSPGHAVKSYWGVSHAACIKDFYDCLAGGKPVPLGIKEVTDTMDLMLGIYESAERKEVITLGREARD